MNDILKNAQVLWDYHKLDGDLKPADVIFGLGSIDIRTAQRSAELYKQGYGTKILFSGGVAHTHDMLRTTWEKPEAVVFAEEAISMGVPKEYILIEDKATNTGENITLGYGVLKQSGVNPKSIILVQKPYMERRTYATFAKQWPGEDIVFYVTSLQIGFEDYIVKSTQEEQERIINIMVGDLQRIKVYPEKGFQIYQEIPSHVWEAYKYLIAHGYDKHLLVGYNSI
jgi:uncharacterized SAM-binding protein YcdF (DUF218 family)